MTAVEMLQGFRELSYEEQSNFLDMVMEEWTRTHENGMGATVPLSNLMGVLNPEGKEITDEEIDAMRMEYLEEKYL